MSSSLISLFEQAKKSIVSIEGIKSVAKRQEIPYRFSRIPIETEEKKITYGSGMIIHPEGYILTCHHVVKDMSTIRVKWGKNKSVFEGKIIGADPSRDVAILKISPTGKLHPVKFSLSSRTPIGEAVFAIGNPFGFDYTLTRGILSGKNRTLYTEHSEYKRVLQTDAALNPGNSGGPLFNSKGRVIGMNAIIIPSYQNMGFAIPVEEFLPLIKRYGKLKASLK